MFETIISFENLCAAWQEFVRGKKEKKDVAEFSLNLSSNLFALHEDLKNKTYEHGTYHAFGISDPKPREIHKATVRDRVLHHAIHRVLYPYFDREFIYDVYSSRDDKGVHRAICRFLSFTRKASKNNRRTCWVLKCDIQKFFASIDQEKLMRIIGRHIPERDMLWLLQKVVGSFESAPGKGLPLGNLTSQLFVNIYMNEFDQFMKHRLKATQYIRYADDFVILSHDRPWLIHLLLHISAFLRDQLKLELHPGKVSITTLTSGIDFLGWVHFSDHRVLRTTTRRRMLKRIAVHPTEGTIQSYAGLLRHGNTHKLKRGIASALNVENNLVYDDR
ncbi:MAG: reverse transcriptase domain-containing protein [Patescibacteria group bacterium]